MYSCHNSTCFTKSLVLTAVFTLLLINLIGQNPPHEDIVVTANTMPVPFKNLSRTVRVISRDEIRNLPVRSVTDLLRYMTSIDVKSRGMFGIQSDFSIRGSGFGQVLILVNGTRLNDSQTGHHNSDIPVALSEIDRVEVLYGPGSSLYGGDSVAGAVNIITRDASEELNGRVVTGQHGLFSTSISYARKASTIFRRFSLWGDRSSGFQYARDFRNIGFGFEGGFGDKSRFAVRFQDKEFGANGFYGPSPSREWTNGTLISFGQKVITGQKLNASLGVSYRSHGDRFVWNIEQPKLSDNKHRKHGLAGQIKLEWTFSESTQASFGLDLGGDWIQSSSLGKHNYSRQSGFFELEHKFNQKAAVYSGLRLDHYSSFGSAVSPSISTSLWILSNLKLRASIGQAFRIPSFTELYYQDPNHLADPVLKAEDSTGADFGLDWFLNGTSLIRMTGFTRWEDNVIDWIRLSPTERWWSTNIRNLFTQGIELEYETSVSKRGSFRFAYTYLNTDIGDVQYYSKYVLDYARHSISTTGSFNLPFSFVAGAQISYRKKYGGLNYWILDGRLKRQFQDLDLYLDISNFLNTDYQEITGVDMPGRWIRFGIEFNQF